MHCSTPSVAELHLAKGWECAEHGLHFQTSHRRYLFRADLCVVQMIPSALNSPDLIKAKNKPFHSATSASNQYLMPMFTPSPLELKQIGCWMPDTAWQAAESNIWLLDTTQLIIWHSLGEIGRPPGPDTNMNPSNPNKAILKHQTGAPETDNKRLLLPPAVQLGFP